MSLLASFSQRKKAPAAFDPNPEEINRMPERPYRVLHANLPFYSDPKCQNEVQDGRLVVLRCEDPRQKQVTIECMPTRRDYEKDQLVTWELHNKRLWDAAWYRNPDSGEIERAWSQSVEFIGRVARAEERQTIDTVSDETSEKAG